jgi:thiol-disulfide isomerase/thioredoxin
MQTVSKTITETIIATLVLIALGTLGISRQSTGVSPVSITLIGSAVPEVQAVVFGADYCSPCRKMKAAIKAEMPGDGWKLANATDGDSKGAHIVFDNRATEFAKHKITIIPTTVFFKNGVEVRRIESPISPNDLAKNFNEVGKK